ncbi:PQQ-dependent sugar dehydrogenase [Sutcliffiella halmapala]|uniref:PQQ-dependent sugar dehydrogenase n=1 Tax=Sutcliffiella halmapala TaxID=79882 RepID=UPI0009957671|nr:PQQ-dependent sugar dehydrogenase [Sutcliffiella halmapala]
MNKTLFLGITMLSIISTGCMNFNQENSNQNPPTSVETNTSEESVEIIAKNLEVPWAISKHQDTFFITERSGSIAKVENGTIHRELVSLTKPLLQHGEGGLLGFTLHPDFDTNQLAFVYHTYGSTEEVKNRVVLVKYSNKQWVEEKPLLEDIEGAVNHNGGRIMIGPDKLLYVTTGDANKPESAQDKSNLTGSILRMELDGSIPTDNPLTDSYIYSYGHRNPQGMAWDVEGEVMYESEHGPSARDEINVIQPGENYGWPSITGDEQEEGMLTPLFHSGTNTWAPSGMVFHKGKLYVASLRGEMIRGFDLDTKEEFILLDGFGRIRDVLIDGDDLYAITNNTDGRGNPSSTDDQLVKIPLIGE